MRASRLPASFSSPPASPSRVAPGQDACTRLLHCIWETTRNGAGSWRKGETRLGEESLDGRGWEAGLTSVVGRRDDGRRRRRPEGVGGGGGEEGKRAKGMSCLGTRKGSIPDLASGLASEAGAGSILFSQLPPLLENWRVCEEGGRVAVTLEMTIRCCSALVSPEQGERPDLATEPPLHRSNVCSFVISPLKGPCPFVQHAGLNGFLT